MKTLNSLILISAVASGVCFPMQSVLADDNVKPIQEVFSPPTPANVKDFMKVAVVQWNPSGVAPVGSSKEVIKAYLQRNRVEMGERVREAAKNGAKFIVLSEFAVIGYPDIPELPPEEDEFRNREDIKDFVEYVPGDSSNYFSKIAKELGVWIQFGTAEVEKGTEKYFNTAVVVNDQGSVAAKFRKNTLYQLENAFLSRGTEAVTFDSPMGKVGLIICADVYNSSLLQKYINLKVDVLSLSTSWAQYNTGMGYFQNAAKRTNSFLLAANQTYFPDSGVINKNGSLQSHIRQSGDSIAYGFIPLKKK